MKSLFEAVPLGCECDNCYERPACVCFATGDPFEWAYVCADCLQEAYLKFVPPEKRKAT